MKVAKIEKKDSSIKFTLDNGLHGYISATGSLHRSYELRENGLFYRFNAPVTVKKCQDALDYCGMPSLF